MSKMRAAEALQIAQEIFAADGRRAKLLAEWVMRVLDGDEHPIYRTLVRDLGDGTIWFEMPGGDGKTSAMIEARRISPEIARGLAARLVKVADDAEEQGGEQR